MFFANAQFEFVKNINDSLEYIPSKTWYMISEEEGTTKYLPIDEIQFWVAYAAQYELLFGRKAKLDKIFDVRDCRHIKLEFDVNSVKHLFQPYEEEDYLAVVRLMNTDED